MTKKESPAVEQRRVRVALAHKILTTREKIDFEKAVALISYNLGITERKAREYIKTLIMVDGIKYDGRYIIKVKK